MKTSLPEIFDAVKEAKDKSTKIKILLDHYAVPVAACLKMLYDPTVKLNLPVGLPDEFKFNNMPYSSLERVIRSIPPLVALPAGPKVEKAWLRLIQPLSKEDVTLLTALKDKDLDLGLTFADVQKSFPTLFGNVTPEVLAQVENQKNEEPTEPEVDNQGSEASEPEVTLPEDPYNGKFQAPVIEEDPTLPSPISENPGVLGIETVEVPTEEISDEASEEKTEEPKKKSSTKKAAAKKKD